MDSELWLRPADTGDMERLLTWRNDPVSVENSMTNKPVLRAEHEAWFAAKLKNPLVYFYIVMAGKDKPAGQIRVDVAGAEGEVSIAMAPECRGKGFGYAGLGLVVADQAHRKTCRSLIAHVWENNPGSMSIFTKNGFIQTTTRMAAGRVFLVFEYDLSQRS